MHIYNGQIIRDIDSTKHNDLFKEAMNNCGFTDLYSLNASCDILYKYLKAEPEVFVYIAHGLESSLVTFDMNNNLDGWVTVNEIVKKDNIDKYLEEMNLSDDKDNRKKLEGMPAYYVENIEKDGLAGTRVALLLGCYTGNDVIYNDITYNLVDLLFEKGAHYVLGTTREVFEDELMLFWETFLEQVNSGESIDTAVTNAIAEAGSDFTYSKGDSSQYLMQ